MTGTPALKSRRFDLIVIGAGPAGAAAAMTAAKSGLRTALVDKKSFPRDKLCGGGLTGRAMRHYQEIFGPETPAIPLERRSSILFHAFGQNLGPTLDAPPLHLGMRFDFDAHLVERAIAAGAADFTGHSARLDTNDPAVIVPDLRLEAPCIIAADGVNSPTARQLFGRAFDQNKIGFALEVELPERSDRPLRIDFGAADWGYGWQFPKSAGTTIGVGGVLARNADMKQALRRYLALLDIQDPPQVKGQFLPFGDFRTIPGKGQILLSGDAAGLVDPITGEGIAHALSSGSLAAGAVVQALQRGQPEMALSTYTDALKPVHSGLRHARRLRNIMFRERLRPAFVRSFRTSRTLRGEYMRLLAGETEYGPLMRQLARRMPSFAWRALTGS